MSTTNKSVVRYSGEENLLLAGYIRTIDMVDNENMMTMHKELFDKHPSVEIRVW